MNRFTAFDVETPNAENNRMSGLGIAIVEDNAVTGSFGTLVNPETYFLPFHIALTGITPEDAEQSPSFGTLWETIEPFFSDAILVAHNAPFDLSVLARCLRAYCIDWKRYVPYLCTVRMARRLLPGLPNHRLDTLCEYYEIPLNHHRADSDSLACAELLIRYLEKGARIEPFLRWYDLRDMRTISNEEAAALRAEGWL